MDQPKYLQLDRASRASWGRDVGLALEELIAFRADQANYQCAGLLRAGKKDEAMSVAGAALAYETLLSDIGRPDAEPPPPEEPFRDPAFRYNPELAPPEEGKDNAGTE